MQVMAVLNLVCLCFRKVKKRVLVNFFFFFGKLTYVLKEEDTNIIRGIPQIYNDNRNIKQQMATG
jgi:hypothetical protein